MSDLRLPSASQDQHADGSERKAGTAYVREEIVGYKGPGIALVSRSANTAHTAELSLRLANWNGEQPRSCSNLPALSHRSMDRPA